jgi:NADH dehydrogenase [ubiquinone] 1 alpha subcomplex assembly factor 3
VEGAVLCLPELWLMWDAPRLSGLSLDALAVLDAMAPPPEVLVVGCGARMRRLPEALSAQLAARGVAVEVLDTVRARAAQGVWG